MAQIVNVTEDILKDMKLAGVISFVITRHDIRRIKRRRGPSTDVVMYGRYELRSKDGTLLIHWPEMELRVDSRVTLTGIRVETDLTLTEG